MYTSFYSVCIYSIQNNFIKKIIESQYVRELGGGGTSPLFHPPHPPSPFHSPLYFKSKQKKLNKKQKSPSRLTPPPHTSFRSGCQAGNVRIQITIYRICFQIGILSSLVNIMFRIVNGVLYCQPCYLLNIGQVSRLTQIQYTYTDMGPIRRTKFLGYLQPEVPV